MFFLRVTRFFVRAPERTAGPNFTPKLIHLGKSGPDQYLVRGGKWEAVGNILGGPSRSGSRLLGVGRPAARFATLEHADGAKARAAIWQP